MADIGWAIKHLRKGELVRRAGWNGVEAGRPMWLELQEPDSKSKMSLPYVFLTVGKGVTFASRIPWTCSQYDLLATDWEIAK
jgi:hypothetical protein